MREETKLIKEILKSKYPDKKFKFRYKMANNYMDSSDTLIVTCERWMDIDDVISYLNKHVDRIINKARLLLFIIGILIHRYYL